MTGSHKEGQGSGHFTPIKPMSSVAAIINPLNKDQALLFYCADTYNLAVEHRALVQSAQSTTYNDNNIATGNITQPGDFAAVYHNNEITCYGITSFTGGDGKPANVASSLSPSINPIDAITNTNGLPPSSSALTGNFSALAACSDQQFNDYVCFIQPNPANAALPQLIEYSMEIDTTSNKIFTTASNQLLPSSRLTSCFRTDDPNNDRYIFAQSSISGNPIVYLSTDNGFPNDVPLTNNASPGNPMAVTTATNSSGNMNMYLFYMDNANHLNKIVYDGTARSWGPPKQVATGM
ncbi:hypothetical protein MMC27_003895 [Xylographa pallens]|nr:hypothetical protein [Xylographa pallens]